VAQYLHGGEFFCRGDKMLSLLVKVIPLNMASALSPGILAVSVLLLGGKRQPVLRSLAFFLGTLVVGVIAVSAGFFLGQALSTGMKQGAASSVIDLILGVIFIVFGFKLFFAREINPSLKEYRHQLLTLFAGGLILSGTNFDALFLSFAAAKEVGGTPDIQMISRICLLVLNLIFFTLPVLLPLLAFIYFPRYAAGFFKKINQYALKYSRFMLSVLFIVFGVVLVLRGIR